MTLLNGASGWQYARQAGAPDCVCAYAAAIVATYGLLKVALVVHDKGGRS
jgi:hypothetical protein